MSSSARRIRDAIHERVNAMAPGTWGKVEPRPPTNLQASDLPFCGVYLMSARATPDGQGNAGEPKFVEDAVIGLSIQVMNGDAVAADEDLDLRTDAVLALLLNDTSFVRFGKDAYFESIEEIGRQRILPRDGETYFGEMRIEINFRYRTIWQPDIVDRFLTLALKARPLLNPDAPLTGFKKDIPQN